MADKKGQKGARAIPMSDSGVEYYRNLGFMCGLEIHQRLATEEKLFCSCTTRLVDKANRPAGSITRYQRAVAGELGTIDRSAEFEELRKRSFTYNVFDENTCLVDIDEEPPHELNNDALNTAMEMASAMGMHFVDEVQIMRKGVIDGSDPSAFQRTMLIALDGRINVYGSEVKIPTIFLEEESSGIQSGTSSNVTYNTDRLAIPLIEVDTDPYIQTPKIAKNIALYIGTLLRLTGKVQRGIGSIRQDVNLSIRDGARVEIKGVQELDLIDKFIENEVRRQQSLIIIKNELLERNAQVGAATNVTPIFRNTEVDVIKYHIKDGAVFAFGLKNFRGFLGVEINPNRRLGTEISDYAKMSGVHGIIHSDEDLKKYRFSDQEINSLKRQLNISEHDSFVLIAGKPEEVRRASELAIMRAKYAMEGVPKETRMVYDNELCTSKFMRPLPTGSRMYPETDVRPVLLTREMREFAARSAPNVERENSYISSKVKNALLVEQLMRSPKLPLYKAIIEKTGADPEFVANVIIQKMTEMRRNGIDVDSVSENSIIEVFKVYADGKITKQAVEEALRLASKDKESSIDEIISKNSLGRISGRELRELIEKLKTDKTSIEQLKNSIMSKYRLNVDGSELIDLLNGKN